MISCQSTGRTAFLTDISMPRCPACHRRLAPKAVCPIDGQLAPSVAQPSEDELSPEFPVIPGYILKDRLGDGGYARVWTAIRESDGLLVALKVGHSDMQAAAARFAREAEILKYVGPPYAPQCYESGLADGKPYIVMELIRGETLAQNLAARPLLPGSSWVASIAEGVAKALDAVHAQSFVHRDLKPENIVIGDSGSGIVLLDFGLARKATLRESEIREPRITRTGMAIGTPEYMAPESVRGSDEVDSRADVYAFGVLLYELFTLRVPFVGSGAMVEHGHVSLRPPRPSDFAPIPALWEQLIFACLAKDPSRRPMNADALLRAIREIVEVEPLLKSMTAPRSVLNPPVSSSKLLSEGRHPTVLLFAEIAGPAALICNRIKASRGHVVRQRGAQYMAIFAGFETDDPAGAAIAVAREIVQKNGRVALHLAPITIRRKERGAPLVYGAAVERPETWLPTNPWSGLVMTNDLESILPPESVAGPISVGPKSLRPSLRPAEMPAIALSESGRFDAPTRSSMLDRMLIGRDEPLAIIENGLRAAFGQRVPRLATLIADVGLGKTRLAEHAIEYCKAHFPDAHAVFATSAASGTTDGMRDSASILGQLVDAPEQAPADIAEFFHRTVDEEMAGQAVESIATLFGWKEPLAGDQTVHRTRAIAQALRRRAREKPVAVILDDAHRADDALLDALEYVTLDGENLPLWVLVTASPIFDEQRRVWGRRTCYFDRIVMAPLSNTATKELAAKLLHPAEYPPDAVLERLANWSGGNPFCLREVVRALKRSGIVRKREHVDNYYVATAGVEVLPPIPAWQWLAVRQLDQMPPELAACVRLCAVLGMSFGREELHHVLDALDRTGKAGSPLDTDVALGVLTSRGVLRRNESDRYSFQNGVLEGAIYETLDPSQRQEVHRHAFELWKRITESSSTSNADALERLGRHAAALGERKAAAQAFLQLGGLLRQKHRHVEADRSYSSVLVHAPAEDKLDLAQAYFGRGIVRYRVTRVKDAIDDFRRACELAEELGHRRMQAEVLLEQATAFDWSREFSTSVEMVRLAEPIVAELDAQDLRVRLLVAQGRAAHRLGKASEAIDAFERARIAAKQADDYDALVITLVLFGFQLAIVGRLDEAEERFNEVVSLLESVNDRPHLCGALANRIALWHARRALDRAMEDLQRATNLAREVGNPWLERMATHNIATLLLWTDDRGAAVEFGRRAQFLTERFFEPAFITSSLLHARILIATNAFEEAARLYEWINRSYNIATVSAVRARWNHALVGLVLSEFTSNGEKPNDVVAAWDAVLVVAATESDPQVMLEILYWRLRTALHRRSLEEARQTLEQIKIRLANCRLWVKDFAELEHTYEELHTSRGADGAALIEA